MDRETLRQRLAAYGRVVAEQEGAAAPDLDALLEARRIRTWTAWALGELGSAWREYGLLAELERRLAPAAASPRTWQGEPLAGRRLWVELWNGGFGDLLQFARFLAGVDPDGGEVTVATRPELLPLLAGSFGPGFTWTTEKAAPAGAGLETGYYRLPFLLRWTHQEIAAAVPYLRPPEDRRAAWRRRLAGRPRPWVGLCWANSPPGCPRDPRCIPLAAFAPLLALPGATFVCLQKEGFGEEIRQAGCADRLLDLGDLGDFAATAALVAELDLAISMDTAIAHLAGALAVPGRLLLPHDPFAGWAVGLDGDRTPWYPTLRLVRQPVSGSWEPALARVAEELADRLERS